MFFYREDCKIGNTMCWLGPLGQLFQNIFPTNITHTFCDDTPSAFQLPLKHIKTRYFGAFQIMFASSWLCNITHQFAPCPLSLWSTLRLPTPWPPSSNSCSAAPFFCRGSRWLPKTPWEKRRNSLLAKLFLGSFWDIFCPWQRVWRLYKLAVTLTGSNRRWLAGSGWCRDPTQNKAGWLDARCHVSTRFQRFNSWNVST